MKRRNILFTALCLMSSIMVGGIAAATGDEPIDWNGDMCEQRRQFDLNDVLARGDFVDVRRVLPAKPVPQPSDPTPSQLARQTVVVDGILMELPQWVVEGMIQNGTFRPVYPGTTIPIPQSGWFSELPCWANPDCPE